MYKNNKVFLLLCALLSAFTLAACSTTARNGDNADGMVQTDSVEKAGSFSEEGILTLRINPEIDILYNSEGKVLSLEGANPDGESVVASYSNYIGKEVPNVLKELIGIIHEKGHLVNEAEGKQRNITLELEPNSVMPSDNFFEQISERLKHAVAELDFTDEQKPVTSTETTEQSSTKETAESDSAASAEEKPESQFVSLDQAKEIALSHAGLEGATVSFDDTEFEIDDGIPMYEIEFYHSGFEYEATIHAESGSVLEYEKEED